MKWLLITAILVGILATSHARNDDDARAVVGFSTRTVIILTTSVTTVPVTCALFPGEATCQKRRYRRFAGIRSLDDEPGGDLEPILQSTFDVPPGNEVDLEGERSRRALALTVWSTTSSTYTYTSESTNTATTFSLSYFCTAVGASFPPAC
ncbi:uncharacterized protein [Penaeus vannamei]|uniref:uncharacterized protein n=1 Tax=Penaeus vannamei TaxID=6689 RepID=UPI00387F6C61